MKKTVLLETTSRLYLTRLARELNLKADVYCPALGRLHAFEGPFKVTQREAGDYQITHQGRILPVDTLHDGHGRAIVASRVP